MMEMRTRKKIATFKDRFNDLCEHSVVQSSKLAEQLGVSKQTISAWKTGTRSPKDLTVKAIADFFEVNVDWLMGYDVEKYKFKISTSEMFSEDYMPNIHSEEARILARGIDKLPKEQREQALAMFKVMFSPQYDDLFTKENEE